MMIPHHAGAVDMARLVLQHGRDPVTRQLAEEIIAGQTVEIQSMQRRLHTLQQRTCQRCGSGISVAGWDAGALIDSPRESTNERHGMNKPCSALDHHAVPVCRVPL